MACCFTPAFQYEVMLKDHLGNTRATVSKKVLDGEPVIEEFHYYPFGMPMDGKWRTVQDAVDRENPCQYNSKEHMAEIGFGWMAYGARMYDASIGRFTGVDPIADRFAELSVYNYASNDPISNTDLHGATAHEVGHTLMTRSSNQESRPGSGGLMVDPPGIVRPKEVDKFLEDAIKRKN